MAFGYTPTGLLGTYLKNIRRPGSKQVLMSAPTVWAKAGRAITGLPSLLGQTMADPRFQDVIDRLAVSEQRAPAADVYYRAKAREAYEAAKAARAEQGRQAAFRQTIGDIERKSAIKQDVQRDIAARTAPESVRAEREALLQQELGPAAYQGVLPPSARRDARGKLTSTPGLLRKQPTARERALTSGISRFDQNRPVRSAVEPLAHQTSEYMTPGYVKSLMGPTAAEREILAFNPEREYLLQMAQSGDPIAARQGAERLGGGGDPAKVAEYKYWSSLPPALQKQYETLTGPSLKYVDRKDGTEIRDSRTGEIVGFIPYGRDPEQDPDYLTRKKQAEEGGKGIAAANLEEWQNARDSVVVQRRIGNLIEHLNLPDGARTGIGARFMLQVNKARAALGDKEARKKATNAEIATALMGSEVFALLVPLGIGARGLDTPAEREFLLKVMTGDITLERETLLQMAKLRMKVTNQTITDWNKRIDKGELDAWFSDSGVTNEKLPTWEEGSSDPLELGL